MESVSINYPWKIEQSLTLHFLFWIYKKPFGILLRAKALTWMDSQWGFTKPLETSLNIIYLTALTNLSFKVIFRRLSLCLFSHLL